MKARKRKNKKKEGRMLFIPRTWITYIELYELGQVEWVLKITTRTPLVISIY
jgi:hypothetical protein